MKYSIKKPKLNTEYTFKFKSDGKISRLRYVQELPNGRLEFFNLEYETYTSMKPERFSYIHRFNLVSEKPIEKAIQQPLPLPKEYHEFSDAEKNCTKTAMTFKEFAQSFIKDLKKLTAEETSRFSAVAGKRPDEYIELLYIAIKQYEDGVQSDYLNGLIGKLAIVFEKCNIKIA